MLDPFTPAIDWPFWVVAGLSLIALIGSFLAPIRKYNPRLSKGEAALFRGTVAIVTLALISIPIAWIPGARVSVNHRVKCVIHDTIRVVDAGGRMPTCQQIEREIARINELWEVVARANDWPDMAIHRASQNIWIEIRERPFFSHGDPTVLAGLAYTDRSVIQVGVDERPLSDSALGHELGHLYLHRILGTGHESVLKLFSKQYGVPY